MKLYFTIVGTFAPQIAAQQASKIFGKPRIFKRPVREQAILNTSLQSILETPVGKLAVYSWSPPNPAKIQKSVLLVHGWSSRGTQLAVPFVPAICALGYRVVNLLSS
jgi:hypothetical protein